MKELSFVLQYFMKPRATGAILPSSNYLANKMVEDIDFKNAKCIIEYGPGTGIFTEKLIENRNQDTIVMLLEYNNEFYNLLKEKFKDEKNLFIINDSAENVCEYLLKYKIENVDYIVSGLPFASLPKHVSENILKQTKNILKKDGKFVTFQYSLFKVKFIKKYFRYIDLKREFRNIPPAYVLNCINYN